tara:strand:+ start:1653 stop:1802 length:150 start_codon:yes stop_codon:yes gene_type:complete
MKIWSTQIPEPIATFEFIELDLFKKNGYSLAYQRFHCRIIPILKGCKEK